MKTKMDLWRLADRASTRLIRREAQQWAAYKALHRFKNESPQKEAARARYHTAHTLYNQAEELVLYVGRLLRS